MGRPFSASRVVLAIFVALLLVVESAGVARAIGPGSTVHCCCGTHAIARACKCLHCPVKLRRARPHEHVDVGAQLAEGAKCAPGFEDGALLVVATPTVKIELAPPDAVALPFLLAPPPPPTIALSPTRPPP